MDVQHGEFVAVLGPSGCGKSTLLRALAGLIQPQSGTISTSVSGRETGFVFQHPRLCPWLTARQNIELPLKLRSAGRNARQQRAIEALELAGLSARDGQKWPHQLSGGMQMRIAVGRALVTQPKLMLMDEPFSALDEILRQQLAETTHRIWMREKWTGVLVTHNVAEAAFLSQRIFILAGRPAGIRDVIDVPFSTRCADLRLSSEFNQFISLVGRRLRQAAELENAPTSSNQSPNSP